jgi:lysophospholipase L1-like esterase
MTTMRRTARAAAAAAIAGTLGGVGILAGQALVARTRRYAQPDMGLAIRSSFGPSRAAPLRLVLLGDSTALGVGVDQVGDTVGGQLAAMLAEGPGGRRVELSSVAVARSRSIDLGAQVSRALVGRRPDVAVILIGGNDAIRFTPIATAAEHLASAVRRLRAAGSAVVVGTCPDLTAAYAFPPPLRHLMGWRSHQLAHAQKTATRAASGIVVDLGATTGAVFRADVGTFCHDGYHPSADGYRVWAHALLPAVLEASGATAS